MGRVFLAAIGIVIAAAFVIQLVRPTGPATTLATSPAPLPFGARLFDWIDSGVPIGAVAELEGRQFLILVGKTEDKSWSVAVDPGDAPEALANPAPVALGPFEPPRHR